jgi:tripartite-type tricarboxylate transporter receptor subunit TctC
MRISVLLALAVVTAAHAQTFPSKPPKLYVGFPPGGGVDQTARITTAKLGEIWGTAIVIENKPGAGGTIGAEATAKAAPDGYTLVLCNVGSHGIGPAFYHRKLGYDPLRDVSYIGMIGMTPNVMAVHPSVPATTVAEFIAYAKANPGKLSYGSSGVGTSPHLGVELFKSMAGIDIVHVPFNGSPPAVTATVQNETQMLFAVMQPLKPQIDAGKLRAIAVTTAKRFPLLPDLPTIAESGYPGFASDAWNGVLVPAATPRPVVERLNREMNAVLKMPDVVQKMNAQGFDLIGGTPEDLGKLIRGETERWAPVIRKIGLKID